MALEALSAGKHVMLEKPPAPTVSELADLERHASARKRVLFATWHSQYNAGVDEARRRLAGQKIASLAIAWVLHLLVEKPSLQLRNRLAA